MSSLYTRCGILIYWPVNLISHRSDIWVDSLTYGGQTASIHAVYYRSNRRIILTIGKTRASVYCRFYKKTQTTTSQWTLSSQICTHNELLAHKSAHTMNSELTSLHTQWTLSSQICTHNDMLKTQWVILMDFW